MSRRRQGRSITIAVNVWGGGVPRQTGTHAHDPTEGFAGDAGDGRGNSGDGAPERLIEHGGAGALACVIAGAGMAPAIFFELPPEPARVVAVCPGRP